jgi:hypothetical protein
MLSGVDELRAKAQACWEEARKCQDEKARAEYLALMAAWRELAKQAARVEQANRDTTPPPKTVTQLALVRSAPAGTALHRFASY